MCAIDDPRILLLENNLLQNFSDVASLASPLKPPLASRKSVLVCKENMATRRERPLVLIYLKHWVKNLRYANKKINEFQ